MSNKKAKSVAFPGQHEGEVVELVFHHHPIVMRRQLIYGLVAILVGILPLDFWPLSALAGKIAIFTPLVVLVYWFYYWVSWYYSVYIVTNERLIEIVQKGFFNRKVTEFGLDKVQNINYHIRGFQAVIFQYGDIIAQTYVGELVMNTIHKPVKIHQRIVDIVRTVNAAEPPPRVE